MMQLFSVKLILCKDFQKTSSLDNYVLMELDASKSWLIP